MSRNKLQEGDGGLLRMDSSLSPDQLPPGFFARGMNIVTRGGIAQCRPGYRCMSILPDGRIQGGAEFKPKVGPAVLVFAVEGLIYLSEYPFREYRQIPGVQFSPTAQQVFFKQVEKSVEVNPDSSLRFVAPRNLLVMQDGALSSAAVFDGTSITLQRGEGTIPAGGPMEWVGDRLWVANGASLYASDLGNPTSFTEHLYIATPSAFTLPGAITALSKTPTTENPHLLAFTDSTTTLFLAGERQRSAWQTTPNFQKEVFQVGCVAARSVTRHHGFLWWYSAFGLTSLDSAAQANTSSALPYRDDEMTDSKSRLSSDLSGIACSTFENYLLVSVPYGDTFNRHTWCLDNTPSKSGAAVPAWNSFWTGTRPVEWISGQFNGVSRSFFLSADFDGRNRLWEAFTPDRLDDGCPITWWIETRALTLGAPTKLKEFRFADVFLSELSGTVDVAVFWAGTQRGKYKRILTKRILAARGSIRSGEMIKATDKLFALKKQSRPLRTQDGRALYEQETLSSCDVESPNAEFKDESFQLLIVGSGPAAVRSFLIYAEPPVNDDDAGRVEVDETEENFVRFDGAAQDAETFRDALETFSADIPLFTSARSETVEQGDITEVGIGEAESVISQANADYVASVIARRKAAEALQLVLPKIVSMGETANLI